MNNLVVIAGGSGLQDGLNPCMMMSAAIFIVLCRNARIRVCFAVFFLLGLIVFNFGPGQLIIFSKEFILTTKVFYFVLGLWVFILGILFLKDWFVLRFRSPDAGISAETKSLTKAKGVTVLTSVVVPILLSAFTTLWPINTYIMILGNASMSKGQWQTATSLIVTYSLMSMWPLGIMGVLYSIKSIKPSMLKIISAAVFFTASTCMVFIFK